MRTHPLFITALLPVVVMAQKAASPDALRPITFLDRQYQRDVGSPTPSPDGKWLLYTLSTPDWNQAKRQTDIYLVSVKDGVSSTRQMTFTKDKNETSPRWSRDGKFFVFLSNRDAPSAPSGGSAGPPSGNVAGQNQIYVMRPDGGEARKITDAKDGVSTLDFSKDGRWLVYRSGKSDEEQLYALPVAGIDSAKPVQLTHQQAGVGLWKWSPDSRRIYFVTADTLDKDEKLRVEKKFNVAIRNMATPLSSLWALDVDTKKATRLTRDTSVTVTDFNISPDGRWIGYHGAAANRYMRNITEQDINSDLYLLDTSTDAIERLTNNTEVGESDLEFSPDSKWIAFSANDDLTQYTMTNNRVYLRRVDDRGGQLRKLGGNFDGDVTVGFWSKDGKTIYFNEGIKATGQMMALDIDKNAVRQISNVHASLAASEDDDSRLLLLNYADPRTPPTLFTVASVDQIPVRTNWRQLTDANPQVRGFALGDEEEINWKSADGKTVGGILIKPVGYHAGTRYPLIVAIHGGPAAADVLGRKRLIMAAMFAVTVPVLMETVATAPGTLIFWRFIEGLLLPPIFTVVLAYVGDEWPPAEVVGVAGLYVSASSLGGFCRFVNLGLHDFLQLRSLKFVYERTVCPVLNLAGLCLETAQLTTNDQWTGNYSVMAIK